MRWNTATFTFTKEDHCWKHAPDSHGSISSHASNSHGSISSIVPNSHGSISSHAPNSHGSISSIAPNSLRQAERHVGCGGARSITNIRRTSGHCCNGDDTLQIHGPVFWHKRGHVYGSISSHAPISHGSISLIAPNPIFLKSPISKL